MSDLFGNHIVGFPTRRLNYFEPRHEKSGFLPMRKQRRSSSVHEMSFQNEPLREKTNNLGFRPGLTQTGLYSHRRWLEA